jgi:hypothetical protein
LLGPQPPSFQLSALTPLIVDNLKDKDEIAIQNNLPSAPLKSPQGYSRSRRNYFTLTASVS